MLLKNGQATINLRGNVKTSVDSERDDAEIYLDSFGVWVHYKDKFDEKKEQLIPNGSFSNVKFSPEERWLDPVQAKPLPETELAPFIKAVKEKPLKNSSNI